MNFYDVLFAQKYGQSPDFYASLFAKQTGGKWHTVSGAVVSFDDALDAPLKSLIVSIDYDANGKTGANLFKADGLFEPYPLMQGAYRFTDGKDIVYADWVCTSQLIECDGGETYKAVSAYIAQFVGVCFYDSSRHFISSVSNNTPQAINYEFTTPQDCMYFGFSFKCKSGTTTISPTDVTDLKIGENITKQSISWQTEGAVYGGTLDVLSGKLTSTLASDGTELATPVEYQLTPIEVRSQLGSNNIWADTGDVSVTYKVK